MASIFWLGTATAVSQVDTFTPATVEVSDVFTLTYTDDAGTATAINFTATAATAANVAAGLVAAWNANAVTSAVATASGTSTVILTAVTAGRPFSVASSTTDGGGANTQTLTKASTTASRGPSDWNVARNWSGNAVPVTGDDVTIDGRGAAAILYGLNQSAVTLASLTIKQGNTYAVGTTTYKLRIGATAITIGEPAADGSFSSGSALVNLDFGSVQTTARVVGTGTAGTSYLEPVMLKGSHASNALTVEGGTVGVATGLPGDTATFATINVEGGRLVCGAGATLTTVTQLDGTVTLNSAVTTVNQRGGSLYTAGTWLLGTLNAIGGTAYLGHRAGSGDSVTTLNLRGGAADFSVNTAAAQVGTTNVRSGTLTQPAGTLTLTTVTLDFNGNDTLQTTAS